MNGVYGHLVIQLKKSERSDWPQEGELLLLILIACILLLMILVTLNILVDA